jgi:hypothetical protein
MPGGRGKKIHVDPADVEKLEIRLEDATTRLTALQIKR